MKATVMTMSTIRKSRIIQIDGRQILLDPAQSIIFILHEPSSHPLSCHVKIRIRRERRKLCRNVVQLTKYMLNVCTRIERILKCIRVKELQTCFLKFLNFKFMIAYEIISNYLIY